MFLITTELQPAVPNIERDVEDIALRIMTDVSETMPLMLQEQTANSPATGRTYFRGGVSHTASPKGSPPRDDTGDLSKSFKGEVVSSDEGRIRMLWYGLFHDERGRPFIDIAFDNTLNRVLKSV